MDSAENSPQNSPSSPGSGKSSPAVASPAAARFHKRLVSKMLFSPDVNHRGKESNDAEANSSSSTGPQKIQLNRSGGRCFLFPRSSSLNADESGKKAEDLDMPLSPIDVDGGFPLSKSIAPAFMSRGSAFSR